MAIQSLEVLELLGSIKSGTGSEAAVQDPKWEGKLATPCFGTITISLGADFSEPAPLSSGGNRRAFSETDVKENQDSSSGNRSFRTVQHTFKQLALEALN